MSWHYSQEQGEGSWDPGSSGSIPSALLRSTSAVARSCLRGSVTASFRGSQFGTTSGRLTVFHGEEASTSSPADFLARTSASPGTEQASAASAVGSGWKWPASFAKYDRDTSLWKTRQCSSSGDLDQFSDPWPKWGSMRDGECWEPTPLELPTRVNGSGFLVTTPTVCMPIEKEDPGSRVFSTANGSIRKTAKTGVTGSANWAQSMIHIGLIPTPMLGEFFLGWPIGWTDLRPLEMVKFQQWCNSHGI